MKKAFATTALAIAASVQTQVYAQSANTTELEPIIVSGGISPVAADEFGRSNTVITRRDIEDRGYATVQEALEAQPGVSISGTGPNERQIRIRGGEGNHTLVLIDGVRASAGDTEFFLRGIDLDGVQRIEILRGPQSVPFGTDAATGVINIITRQAGEGMSFGGSAVLGEGDRQSLYYGYGGDAGGLSLTLSNLNDRGYDFSGTGGERDGTRWQAGTAKGDLNLGANTEAGFSFRYAKARYDFDEADSSATSERGYVIDSEAKERRLNERAGSIYLEHRPGDGAMSHKLRFDRTSNQTDNSFASDTRTDVAQYRLQAALDQTVIAASDQLVSFLVERRKDEDNGEAQNRENDSAALEYQTWLSESLSLQAGLRRDDNNIFGNATTWNIASSYFFAEGLRLHASAGRAVVNPTFFEVTGGTDEAVNSDLAPEKNRGFDVGVEVPVAAVRGSLDVTYFRETLTDEILYERFADGAFIYTNRDGDSDRQGVEVALSAQPVASLDLNASYTYLDATGPNGDPELRRPRNELGLRATWRLPTTATELSGDLRYVRGLYANQFWTGGETAARLPDFTVLNLAANHQLTEHLELTARITNALDEDYQEVWGYATRNRAAYVGVRASW